MGEMASQITSLTIVYSTIYSGKNQRRHQSSASLAYVSPVNKDYIVFPVLQNMVMQTKIVFLWQI